MRFGDWRKTLLGGLIIILFLMFFWNWDWLIPLIAARASAALGQEVTIEHLAVSPGRQFALAAEGVTVANPKDFPAGEPPLAHVARLVVSVDLLEYLLHPWRAAPGIEADAPVINFHQLASGKSNFALPMGGESSGATPFRLGALIIHDGQAHAIMPAQKSDFSLTIDTQPPPPGSKLFAEGETVVGVRGKYAGAPITGQFTGGTLLALRGTVPYPVDLHMRNGTTVASVTGTIDDPAHFAGAHLRLSLSGQSMADLFQLTGVPIPQTPPYSLAGELNYAAGAFRFDNIQGRVGSSDLEGSLAEKPGRPRREITGTLLSHHVDLTDLAGFLGGTPGKISTPGQDAATKAQVVKAVASPKLLPSTPFNLPKIDLANFDLQYHGEHIINRDVPLDNLTAHLVILNGRITVDPLNFAVGTGTIASKLDLNPVDGVLHTTAGIEFHKLQLARLMAATHSFAGDGTMGGSAQLTGTGNSVAAILGHGNGHATVFLQHGAHLSALLVDLAGMQFGDAVLSALGIPQKTDIHCMVSDFGLKDGLVDTRTFLIATSEANILGSGTVNLQDEKLDLEMRTRATHISIGSFSTPINITGTLKNPSVNPAYGLLAARIVPAIGLGVLFPPLALLPTIRLGLGDKNACTEAITAMHQNQAASGQPLSPAPRPHASPAPK
jgi:uncharacterized protein involved in outer membrane biogenesis